jgi:U6 snRNA-associated Sm-like protein LSm4
MSRAPGPQPRRPGPAQMLPLSLLRTATGNPMVRSSARACEHSPFCHSARLPVTSAQLVELKNGETFNGTLVGCDTWMNIRCALRLRTHPCRSEILDVAARHLSLTRSLVCSRSLKEVICTSRDGDRFWRLPEVIIRGNNVKYLRIPEEVIDMVPEEEVKAPQGKGGRGGGRGEGRGGRGGRGEGRGGGRAAAGGRGTGRASGRGRG